MPKDFISKVPIGDPDLSEALLQYDRSEIRSVWRGIKYVNLKSLSISEAIAVTGILLDISDDLGEPDGREAAIRMGLWLLNERNLSGEQKAKIHYIIANCHYSRFTSENAGSLVWDSEDIENAIYHYRKSIIPNQLRELHDFHKCQLHTNFGNTLSISGRFLEALQHWNRAIEVDPLFHMARGNRGQGLNQYARLIHDVRFRPLIRSHAYFDLLVASLFTVRKDAAKMWKNGLMEIQNEFSDSPLSISMEIPDVPLGVDSKEKKYRSWCLERRLFLNPICDLGEYSAGASDPIESQFQTQNSNRAITAQGLFNQIKQEYATARYLLYRGLTFEGVHFSDMNVELKNTLDYPKYGFAFELLKAAIRIFISIFEHIAYFLNYYFQVGKAQNKVDHNSIWHSNWYTNYVNPGLYALYWLNKDLNKDSTTFVKESLDPGMADVKQGRNWLEHRYLKIQSMSIQRTNFEDELAEYLSVSELDEYALRAGKKARTAIMYLYITIQVHEMKRSREGIQQSTFYFDTWEDDWKTR